MEEKHTFAEWEIKLGVEVLSSKKLNKELLTKKEFEDSILVTVE